MANAKVLSHWDHLEDSLQLSTMEFYERVESAIAKRQLPDVTTERIEFAEGGIGSANRLYLRVRRKKLTFDICSAPYGSGHFFSWWLAEQPMKNAMLIGALALVILPYLLMAAIVGVGFFRGTLLFFIGLGAIAFLAPRFTGNAEAVDDLLRSLPVLGPVYQALFKPMTYYSVDTRLMFQASVHRAVSETINDVLQGHGLRALEPEALAVRTADRLR